MLFRSIAGVDVDESTALEFRGRTRPVYRGVREASAACDPDLVVIATPTGTHAAVCDRAARWFPEARLLVEKPAAATLDDARRILSAVGGPQPVDVAYHTSFAPEVSWGVRALDALRPGLGGLVSAELFFADPYYDWCLTQGRPALPPGIGLHLHELLLGLLEGGVEGVGGEGG